MDVGSCICEGCCYEIYKRTIFDTTYMSFLRSHLLKFMKCHFHSNQNNIYIVKNFKCVCSHVNNLNDHEQVKTSNLFEQCSNLSLTCTSLYIHCTFVTKIFKLGKYKLFLMEFIENVCPNN